MPVRGVEGESEREGGRVDREAGDLSADDGRGDVHQGVPRYDVRPVPVRDVGDRLVDREVEVDPLVVPPSLETCSWKVCWVRLTVGVPHIVPLSSPELEPWTAASGTKVQLVMLPLTSEGSIGVISVPRSRTKEVWL